MEQIINKNNIDDIFLEADYDSSTYQKLIQELYLDCIKFQINLDNNQYKEFNDNFENYEKIEKLSLYILTNYTKSINNQFPEELVKKAMYVSAVAFEKLGFYMGTLVDSELIQEEVQLKQIRYYFRSAVAYTLAENPPNSCVVANKMTVVIEQINNYKNVDYLELLILCSDILRRKFTRENKRIKDKNLITLMSAMHSLFKTGEKGLFEQSRIHINELKSLFQREGSTFRYYVLNLIELAIIKIWENSIWTLLTRNYNNKYLQTLTLSTPPIYELWPNQKDVILNDNSILNNDEVKRAIINFNTSGGKSLIAELAIVKELMLRPEKKCLYIVPTNALVHEVTNRFKKKFRRLNIGVTNLTGVFEQDINKSNDDNIIITTPEKLLTIIQGNYESHYLESVSLIIYDEFHKIADRHRGWTIESTIWFLISHKEYKRIKLLILSAIMDNSEVVLNWLDDNNNFSDAIYNNSWKPSQTLKAIAHKKFKWNNKVSEGSDLYDKWHDEKYELYYEQCILTYYNVQDKEIEEGYQLPLFIYPKYRIKEKNDRGTRPFARKKEINKRLFATAVAQQLSKLGTTLILLNTKPECEKFVSEYEPFFESDNNEEERINFLINYISKRYDKEHLLIKGLKNRVIFHYGSLPDDIREALEDTINMGLIKLIVSTTTLLEGVNFPIQNFVYYGKTYESERTISIGDLKNIAGRAGRAHKYTYGQIIFVRPSSEDLSKDTRFEQDKLLYSEHANSIISSITDDEEFIQNIESVLKEDEENQDELLYNLSILPFFQTLLVLYSSKIAEDDTLENLINKTLFGKYLANEKMNSVVLFSEKVFKYFNQFDQNRLLSIQQSGLSISGYKKIEEVGIKFREQVLLNKNIINNFMELIPKEIFLSIVQIEEFQLYKVRKSTGNSRVLSIDDYSLLLDWFIEKKSIPELITQYFNKVDVSLRVNRITEYIKDVFEYKLPWAFNVLFALLDIDSLQLDDKEIRKLKEYPKFIKHGLSNSLEIKLIDIGFNSRETVIDLAKLLSKLDIEDSHENILKALITLSEHDFSDFTEYEVRKIMQVINFLKKMTTDLEEKGVIVFNVAATKYYLCKLHNAEKQLDNITSENLVLKREKDNYYDEFAIKVALTNGEIIGYVPRDSNEEIAYYLDLDYKIKVNVKEKNIVDLKNYIKVTIELNVEH